MKRLLTYLAATAALAIGLAPLSASAYEAPLLAVDDPIAMHDTASLVEGLILQDSIDNAFELVAAGVDNSISPLCRADHAGSAYQRPGGFCDAVAAEAYGSDGTLHAPGAGPTGVCVVDGSMPPVCT